ncbi:hypothetical protein OPV22_000673 [Ensete ventricosum]|uniref:Abscisic stress ripening n=1 Tax=Ensete ventricosum TaxID=4639 RepID=A0AAV8RUM6_ENSVE|nr:hypothetical protein OPV22_000673 [Ensete ventricosum]
MDVHSPSARRHYLYPSLRPSQVHSHRSPSYCFSLTCKNMAEEHHHHLFHHHKDEKPAEEVIYSETAYSGGGDYASGYTETVVAESATDEYEKYKKEEKHHKHKEHLGEMGAVAAGAFALYEKHEAKKDPDHAHKHKIEEEIAAAVARKEASPPPLLGAALFDFHVLHQISFSFH